MNIIYRIRLYHATLASLSLLAYVTGELGIVHAWLGYAPPNHRDAVIHHTRDDAEADTEHFDGKTTE